MLNSKKVLVIVPAYNEEESLERTVDELVSVVPDIDYLVVNDGSKDATEQICLDRGFNHVTLCSLMQTANIARSICPRCSTLRSPRTPTSLSARAL